MSDSSEQRKKPARAKAGARTTVKAHLKRRFGSPSGFAVKANFSPAHQWREDEPVYSATVWLTVNNEDERGASMRVDQTFFFDPDQAEQLGRELLEAAAAAKAAPVRRDWEPTQGKAAAVGTPNGEASR